jgi:hypothetical protein
MNPTSKIIAEWVEGCSEETKAYVAANVPFLDNPLDAFSIIGKRYSVGGVGDPIHMDWDRLRTLILRRLDGAERARACARWYLESDECAGSIYDTRAVREALTKVSEALDA